MEKLYNNILLEDHFSDTPSDANEIPYLKNRPEVINVSVGRQLFVDDFLIDATDLKAVYHKAKKFEGNPVLSPDKPWETAESPLACPKSGGIWYDEKERIFKMWYEGGWLQNMCYAASTDGIHWEKPDLGIVPGTNIILPYPHERGNTVPPFFHDKTYFRPNSTTVWLDQDAPPSERYKLFMRNPGGEYPGIIAASEDGLHFHDFQFTGIIGDRSTIFYNPFRKKWIHSVRSQSWNGMFERSRIYYECDDFWDAAKWDKEKERYWMKVDDLDLPHPYIQEKPQLYNVDCVAYESIMLGMFQILYGPGNNVCAQSGVPKITELIPMYSRDGYHFSRPCRNSMIDASMYAGAWDRGYVQSVGGVTVINGDELWIYYIAFAGDPTKTFEYETNDNGMYCNGATGLAKLRRDGFVSMEGNGYLLTPKITYTNKTSLHINAVGTVYAEFLDSNGKSIDRSNIFCGDSTDTALTFENISVSDYNEKIIRLRFFVNGKLYAFGFTDEQGDFGGGRAAGVVK